MNTICFRLCLVLLTGFLSEAKAEPYFFEHDPDTVYLSENLLYENFRASDEYLVWLEYYTKSLYWMDVSTGIVESIELTKGRGPNEYQNILSLGIIKDTAYIYDASSIKLIRYNLKEKRFLSDLLVGRQFFGLMISNNSFYGINIFPSSNFESVDLFYSVDLENNLYLPLEGGSIRKNILMDQIEFMGNFLSNNNYLIRVSNLSANLYQYNLKEKKLDIHSIDEIEAPKIELSESGNFNGPIKAKFKINASNLVPNKNILLFSAEGKSLKKEYKTNILYQYDIKEKTFLDKKIEFSNDISIRDIASNRNYFYVYDENNQIIIRLKNE